MQTGWTLASSARSELRVPLPAHGHLSISKVVGEILSVRRMPRLTPNCDLPEATVPRFGPCAPVGCIGLRVRRFFVAAMEQQMWFFGCDAACADSNLLVRYGFERSRCDDHRGDSSCYRFRWRPRKMGGDAVDASVDLHGWCAGLQPLGAESREGGFLYVRARNRVGWYDAPEPPAPGDYDDLPDARRAFRALGRRPEPGFCRAAARFLDWLEEYEDWIKASHGFRYRQRCFERAPQPWLPPERGRAWLSDYRQALSATWRSSLMPQPTLEVPAFP